MISSLKWAKLCKVLQGAVDRVFDNHKGISIKTDEKIFEIAKSYGFMFNPEGVNLLRVTCRNSEIKVNSG